MISNTPVPARTTYLGLFLIALATLSYEVLLTRVFSNTMFFHFAFVAVSLAMFGLTAGAVLVFIKPDRYAGSQTLPQLSRSALLFAVTIPLTFLAHLSIPFAPDKSLVALYSIALTYVLLAIPFVFSGVCLCLCMTQFPTRVGRLYAADLAGSAAGCLAFVLLLRIMDAPSAVIATAALAAAASLLFSLRVPVPHTRLVAAATLVLLAGFAFVNSQTARNQNPILGLRWVRGKLEKPAIFDKWDTISRIRVSGNPDEISVPTGWGQSPVTPADTRIRRLLIDIDAGAGTDLIHYDGNTSTIDFLKYDITNMVHYLKHDASVAVIGAGGGRDLLSALTFGQKKVVGIELNSTIVDIVRNRFADFGGHLATRPGVSLVNDEGYSYLVRTKDSFDIIQVSLIDTWAATAAGAFALAENSLYTREAWSTFLNRLNPGGFLSFTRWYYEMAPSEIYRLLSLANVTLRERGVSDPRQHVAVIRYKYKNRHPDTPAGVGTVLVSLDPITSTQLDTLEHEAARLQFDVMLSPRACKDPNLLKIVSSRDLEATGKDFAIRIDAPTLDSPFFFQVLRLRDLTKRSLWAGKGIEAFHLKSVAVLGALLVTVLTLSFACIVLPLWTRRPKALAGTTAPLLGYFVAIGLGFMFVEISQMQRLTVFLGRPSYGIAVVLFALLLATSLGSFVAQRIFAARLHSRLAVLCSVSAVLLVFGLATPLLIAPLQRYELPVRLVVAFALVFGPGFALGFGFPMGMNLASKASNELPPLLWGANGAASVCASVLAVLISLGMGISATYWTGLICYIAALTFYWLSARKVTAMTPPSIAQADNLESRAGIA